MAPTPSGPAERIKLVIDSFPAQLSAALLAAGRPHSVLPPCGITHMAAHEQIAGNMLLLQRDFLCHALGLRAGSPQ